MAKLSFDRRWGWNDLRAEFRGGEGGSGAGRGLLRGRSRVGGSFTERGASIYQDGGSYTASQKESQDGFFLYHSL